MLTNQIIAWNFKQLLKKELMALNFQVRERSLSVCPGRIWEGPAGERRSRSSSVFAIRDNDNTVIDITDNTDYDETEARCQAARRSRSHSQPIGQMIYDIESRKVNVSAMFDYMLVRACSFTYPTIIIIQKLMKRKLETKAKIYIL